MVALLSVEVYTRGSPLFLIMKNHLQDTRVNPVEVVAALNLALNLTTSNTAIFCRYNVFVYFDCCQ